MLANLIVFHKEISGNDVNNSQPQNIWFISTTFEVFHFEILGIDDNNLQL